MIAKLNIKIKKERPRDETRLGKKTRRIKLR